MNQITLQNEPICILTNGLKKLQIKFKNILRQIKMERTYQNYKLQLKEFSEEILQL